jgi:hypothetical protein
VAKKVRTPPPPRRVQAPQRRDPRKDRGTARSPWLYAAGGAAVAALLAAAVIGVIVVRGDDSGAETTTPTNYNNLAGVRRTKAPWPPEYEFLPDRLLPLGLHDLTEEGAATHIHAHVDIFVDGKRVTVPPNIGVTPSYLTELHTHDTRGLLHIESPEADDEFTLGQFFAEWGVFLNGRCVGSYCDNLRWYVNGERQTGNPAGLVFKSHQQIAIVVGKPPAKIPASYKFRSGE